MNTWLNCSTETESILKDEIVKKEKDLEEIYSKSVSEIGKELFTEFLSDESRKRQTNLLLSSIIAILLSFTLVKPTQISFGAIRIDSVNSQLFIFLSGLTCLYFITIYILSVTQDLEVYKFRKMPLTLIWRDLQKKINDADKDFLEEMNKADALMKEGMTKRIALAEIEEELDSMLRAKTDKLKNTNGFIRITDPVLQNAYTKLYDLEKEIYQTTQADGVDEVWDRQKEVIKKRDEILNKGLFLQNMNEKYDRLNKIKMFIEIGFPILLGISGIGSTIFALLK